MAKTSWLKARLIGLSKAVWVSFAFLFPLDLIVLVFPGTLREGWAAIKQAVTPYAWRGVEPDWRLFLLHLTFGGFILLGLGALLTGATHYLERYMHAFFLLTPLWLMALMETSGSASAYGSRGGVRCPHFAHHPAQGWPSAQHDEWRMPQMLYRSFV